MDLGQVDGAWWDIGRLHADLLPGADNLSALGNVRDLFRLPCDYLVAECSTTG